MLFLPSSQRLFHFTRKNLKKSFLSVTASGVNLMVNWPKIQKKGCDAGDMDQKPFR